MVVALKRHDIDVLTTNDANMTGSGDIEQIEFANSQKRIIYTFNVRDFLPLHYDYLNLSKKHSGIILGEQNRFGVGEQMRRLLRIIEAKSIGEMQNEIEFLSNW